MKPYAERRAWYVLRLAWWRCFQQRQASVRVLLTTAVRLLIPSHIQHYRRIPQRASSGTDPKLYPKSTSKRRRAGYLELGQSVSEFRGLLVKQYETESKTESAFVSIVSKLFDIASQPARLQ